MARIATYNEDLNISGDDLLLGTDADDNSISKNYKVERLKEFMANHIKPYEVYVARFSQSGTNNPVVTEFENTTGDTIAMRRDGVGTFFVETDGSWVASNVYVLTEGGDPGITRVAFADVTGNSVEITNRSIDGSATLLDNVENAFIEIRIYG